jgi:prolipoprotein diacylglyceryltransferase
LDSDFDLEAAADIPLMLKKYDGEQGGSYIACDCDGLQNFRLEGEYLFSEDYKYVNTDGSLNDTARVKAAFAANMESWGDLKGELEAVARFAHKDSPDIVYSSQSGYVDYSATSNAESMVFPEGYVPGSTPPAYNWETGDWVYRGDELARHPSQLYESVLEGWLPLLVLSILIWKFGALKRPGLVAGLFLLFYGFGRSIAENFREPDAFVSGLPEWLTMGMILSVPMWLGGAWLVWNALRKPPVGAPQA